MIYAFWIFKKDLYPLLSHKDTLTNFLSLALYFYLLHLKLLYMIQGKDLNFIFFISEPISQTLFNFSGISFTNNQFPIFM